MSVRSSIRRSRVLGVAGVWFRTGKGLGRIESGTVTTFTARGYAGVEAALAATCAGGAGPEEIAESLLTACERYGEGLPQSDDRTVVVLVRGRSAVPQRSVVVSSLQKVNVLVRDQVKDSMLLREPPRPDTRPEVLERLGLADSGERVSHDGLDDVDQAKRHPPLWFDPVPEILTELGLEDGRSLPGHDLLGGLEPELPSERLDGLGPRPPGSRSLEGREQARRVARRPQLVQGRLEAAKLGRRHEGDVLGATPVNDDRLERGGGVIAQRREVCPSVRVGRFHGIPPVQDDCTGSGTRRRDVAAGTIAEEILASCVFLARRGRDSKEAR